MQTKMSLSNMIWAFGEAALASGGGGAGPLGGAGTLIFASASCQVRIFSMHVFLRGNFLQKHTKQSRKPDTSDRATFKVLSVTSACSSIHTNLSGLFDHCFNQ